MAVEEGLQISQSHSDGGRPPVPALFEADHGGTVAFNEEGDVVLLGGAELEGTVVVIEIIVGVVSGNINAIAINIPSTITVLRRYPGEAGAIAGSGQVPSII